MSKFVNSRILRDRVGKVDEDKCDLFIKMFNDMVTNAKTNTDVFHLNTLGGLEGDTDGVPLLNDTNFFHCMGLAEEEGWKLTRSPDNYQTTTYSLKNMITFI